MSKIYSVTVGLQDALNLEGSSERIEKVKLLASKLFGGVTCRYGNGAWVDPSNGKLDEEPVITFEVVTGSGEEGLNQANYFAATCRDKFGQKCVLLTAVDCIKAFI